MTLPTLEPLAVEATNASKVFTNDVLLRDTFGAFDIATNINEVYSPIIIGPVRRFFTDDDALEGDSHIIWKVPAGSDVLLRELSISVSPVPGSSVGTLIDDGSNAIISVERLNHTQLVAGPGTGQATTSSGGTLIAGIQPNSASDFTLNLSDAAVSPGDYVRVYTSSLWNDGQDPHFYASMAVLAYMKHRTD